MMQGQLLIFTCDLTNVVYKTAAKEWATNLLVGRSDKDENVGDIVETLLNFSLGVKEGLLDWASLGINQEV